MIFSLPAFSRPAHDHEDRRSDEDHGGYCKNNCHFSGAVQLIYTTLQSSKVLLQRCVILLQRGVVFLKLGVISCQTIELTNKVLKKGVFNVGHIEASSEV